jgi:hypothetical protein
MKMMHAYRTGEWKHKEGDQRLELVAVGKVVARTGLLPVRWSSRWAPQAG